MPDFRYRLTMLAAIAAAVTATAPRSLPAQDLLAQARALQQRRQLDSAYTVIQRAVEAEPDRAEVQYALGDIACSRAQRIGGLGAYGTARKCKQGFSRAVQLVPENADYLEALASYLSQAPGIVGGDRDSAIALARHLIRIDETRGTFALVDALGRGSNRQKAQADSVLDAFGRAHPSERVLQIRVASAWAQRDRPDQALGVYQRLLARDSTDGLVRYGVARNLVVLQRDPEEARRHLRYVTTRPLPPEGQPRWSPEAAWWRLGQSWVQSGVMDSARAAYREALRINPEFRQARQSLDSLGRR